MEINGMEVELDLRYSEMNLSQGILQALNQKGFTMATPVQAGAIPCFKDWKDVIAKAPTGSGKTFAFGIPMVEHTDPEGTEVTGLILAPTRELALQIQDEIRQLCAFLPGIRVACLYGGQPIDRQINQLKKHPQIVVATPGRLMDHMKRRTIRLHKVETVVLDEADRMLDMGFIKDVTRILKQIPHRRNLGMFSATISREVMDISWVYQRDPVEIVVRPVQENRPQIQQYRIKVDQGGKVDLLIAILEKEQLDRVIVFCNTKDKPADRTDDPFLVEKMCAELEGILLWCLEGLHRLVQNDFRFTVSERAAANVDTIKRSSNNVIDFMESEGYFRFKADYSISSKEFYDIYKQWCEDNACHSVSAIRFSAELRQNDRRYNLEATNNIYLPGGRRVRGFVGIEPLVHPCP